MPQIFINLLSNNERMKANYDPTIKMFMLDIDEEMKKKQIKNLKDSPFIISDKDTTIAATDLA